MGVQHAGVSPLSEFALEELAQLITAALNDEEIDAEPALAIDTELADWDGPAVLGLRNKGKLIKEIWIEEGPKLLEALEALRAASSSLPERPDAFEWAPSRLKLDLDLRTKKGWNTVRFNVHRGVMTLEMWVGKHHRRWSAFEIVTIDEPFRPFLELWGKQCGVTEAEVRAQGRAKMYETRQFVGLIDEHNEVEAGPQYFFRGAPIVPIAQVNREQTHALHQKMGDFLLNHIEEDGRMHYMWRPAVGEDAAAGNNMIRQWMATIALCRMGHFRNRDRDVYAKVEKNIRFNLKHYYYAKGSHGFIEWDNRISLGSLSLAAIALMEHPSRTSWARVERKLCATVEAAWSEGGVFQCQLKPAMRDHGIDFYPGESLLMWSYLLKEKSNPRLMAKFMASYRYYKAYHLVPENRQPAFVPWHTQAYFNVWQITGDKELVDFTFTMNDWLVDVMARWGGTPVPDTPGQFFSPKHPEYGTPHASSTGVYMEGLIDAFRMARELGEAERAERYRLALVRAVRSIMQQTFLEPIEAWYCPERGMNIGGTRTTVYNAKVRCDNVQHALMGLMKILTHFGDDDFAHPAWTWAPPN